MVSQNWKSTNKSSGSSPRAVRGFAKSGGAPARSKPSRSRREGNAFIGFLMLVVLHAALVWLGVRALESAEIVTWRVGVWDSLRLASVYVVWQSLSLMRLSGTKKW